MTEQHYRRRAYAWFGLAIILFALAIGPVVYGLLG